MKIANEEIIKVTCAIIEDNGRILAAQRGENMGMSLKWEFPGGKMEKGEGADECIKREIKEELDIDIEITGTLPSHVHDYGTRNIELIPFICRITGGNIYCREHKKIIWDEPYKLSELDWAEADVPIYLEYLNALNK